MDNIKFDMEDYMEACGFKTHQEVSDATNYSLDTIRSFASCRRPVNARALRNFKQVAAERGIEWPTEQNGLKK